MFVSILSFVMQELTLFVYMRPRDIVTCKKTTLIALIKPSIVFIVLEYPEQYNYIKLCIM